jgi:hypothetical protein
MIKAIDRQNALDYSEDRNMATSDLYENQQQLGVYMSEEVRGRCRKWTQEDENYLAARWLAGDRLAAIAHALGRTSGACTNRILKLGAARGDVTVKRGRKSSTPATNAATDPTAEKSELVRRTRRDYRSQKRTDMIG